MKIRTVEFAGSVADPKAPLPGELPQVAFSGRSNVGKSSLINTLLQRTRKKVAHVSARPGKTQTLNFYRVNDRFFLVDLPGFGYARAPVEVREGWKGLVEGYLARRPDGPIGAVHLLDARREPSTGDREMLAFLAEVGLPTLLVVTKIDKLTRSGRAGRVKSIIQSLELDPEQVVPFSAVTGEGRETLLGALDALLPGTGGEEEVNEGGEDGPGRADGPGRKE